MRFPNLKKWFLNNPALVIIIPGIVFLIFCILMDYNNGVESKDFYGNITASVIEVFMLGLVIVLYNKLSERKEIIRRCELEIDSYRPWQESEATYRICGLIRNLNNYNISNINLGRCYLPNALLYDAKLQGANLFFAHLENASLEDANLKHANLYGTKLSNANLRHANLQGACLDFADLKLANLEDANLQDASFILTQIKGVSFKNTNLQGVNFIGVEVESLDWIESLEKCSIIGIEYIKEKYCIDEDRTEEEELGIVTYSLKVKKNKLPL